MMLLQGGDDDEDDESSRPVSYREAQPLPYGPLVRMNAPVDAPPPPPAPASVSIPGQGLVYIPNTTYSGGISLAPMVSSPRRPRSARIDPDPPGCLPPPRDKRTAKGTTMVHFDKSPSSSQKEMIYQPSNNYRPPPPPYAATKEPVSPTLYRPSKVVGNGCRDLDRSEDCDDCCDECCVPSHHRHRRRRHRSSGNHHHDHHDYYIHYNPQIWVDGVVRDTLESDQIEPINNYLTQLFPMVKVNPFGKQYPPIVVDDNMESLKKDHIIHPYGFIKILWDTFIGILIVYSITEIPMIVAFRLGSPMQYKFALSDYKLNNT